MFVVVDSRHSKAVYGFFSSNEEAQNWALYNLGSRAGKERWYILPFKYKDTQYPDKDFSDCEQDCC